LAYWRPSAIAKGRAKKKDEPQRYEIEVEGDDIKDID
jgi:hypothetical protein